MFDITGTLFLVLFLILILWPQFQMMRIKSARLNLIKSLEKKLDARVITMIHRRESVAFFNIPVFHYIDIEDSEAVLRAIRTTPRNKPITMVLHTPGGLVLAAAQIAEALNHHPAKKIVIVPHYAMSGGTLIALAADEIWLDPNAVLGSLDPQISKGTSSYPAISIVELVKEKDVKDISDEMLILADISKKAIAQSKEIVVHLLEDNLGKDKAEEIAEILVESKWTHDYPITADKAKEIGLPVKIGIPDEVYKLMDLYPQATVRRPSVEFIPTPHVPTSS